MLIFPIKNYSFLKKHKYKMIIVGFVQALTLFGKKSKLNKHRRANTIPASDFSILYTKLPHNKLFDDTKYFDLFFCFYGGGNILQLVVLVLL